MSRFSPSNSHVSHAIAYYQFCPRQARCSRRPAWPRKTHRRTGWPWSPDWCMGMLPKCRRHNGMTFGFCVRCIPAFLAEEPRFRLKGCSPLVSLLSNCCRIDNFFPRLPLPGNQNPLQCDRILEVLEAIAPREENTALEGSAIGLGLYFAARG